MGILTYTFACERQKPTRPLLREELGGLSISLMEGGTKLERGRRYLPVFNDQGT